MSDTTTTTPTIPVCDLPSFGNDAPDKLLPPWINSAPMEIGHTRIPRLGRTNDIMVLVTGTQEESKEYLIGLAVSSAIIFIVFLVWIVFLCSMKTLGSKRVGFWSGQRKPLPIKPQPKEMGMEDGTNNNSNSNNNLPPPILPSVQMSNYNETWAQPSSLDNSNPQNDPGLENDNNNSAHESWTDHPDLDSNAVVPVAVPPVEGGRTSSFMGERQNNNSITADTPPPQQATATMTLEEWTVLYQRKIYEQRWMKLIVLVASLTVIAMAILMVLRGVRNLKDSASDSQSSLNTAQTLIENGATLIDGLSTYLQQFQINLTTLISSANTACPAQFPNGICANVTDPTTCSSNNTIFTNGTIQTLISTARVTWDETEINLIDRLNDLSSDLLERADSAAHASNTITTFSWLFYVAMGFAIILAVLAFCMIMALLCPLPWILRCLQNRLLLPIFLLCTGLSFTFAIAFLICSLVLADT
jgi:hypothetical protein